MSACKECPWEEKWIQNICVECHIDNQKKIIQEIKRVYLDTFDIMTVTDIVKKSPVKSPEFENLKKQVEFLNENYFANNDSKGKMVKVLVDKFQKNQQIDVSEFCDYDWNEGYFYTIKLTETMRAYKSLKNI